MPIAAKSPSNPAIELLQNEKTGISRRTARRLFSLSSVLLILHGLIEVLSLILLFNPSLPGPHFIFAELQNSPQAVAGVGVVSGLLRLAAAFGILKNREWGWTLGLLMSGITFSMLTFYLPAGATDAFLSGGVLVALLVGRFQGRPITATGS
jgi:hypothetical protein